MHLLWPSTDRKRILVYFTAQGTYLLTTYGFAPPPFLAGKLKPLTPNIFAGFKGPLGGMAKERGKGRKEGENKRKERYGREGKTPVPSNEFLVTALVVS